MSKPTNAIVSPLDEVGHIRRDFSVMKSSGRSRARCQLLEAHAEILLAGVCLTGATP